MRNPVVLAILLVLIPTCCFGFALVEHSPLLSHYEVLTTEEVVLVFDASLSPATVTNDNVYLEPRDGGDPLSASLSVQTTTLANDTIVLVTDALLPFAQPLRIVITGDLKDVGGGSFSGTFPDGEWFVPNVPTDLDRPQWDPQNFTAVFVNANVLLGFNPIDPEGTDPAQPWEIPGISATEAWKIHAGRPDVLVASIDTGFSSLHDPDLIDRLFLNIGELPTPQIGSVPCADNDCNGDGRFSASDYNDDPRVVSAAASQVSPMDLIETFSDEVDDDINGYVDDICGYDIFRDANTPLGVSAFPEGTHANLTGKAAVSEAGNGHGDKPGVCPNCTLLPVRVSDAVVGDLNALAEGARYATEMGAKVLIVALGSLNYTGETEQVFMDAYEQGVVTVAASGDELGYHHLYPAAGEDVINVHGVMPIPAVDIGPFNLGAIGFLESYCTNYGAHTTHTVSTGACSSEAVGNGAGMAALIISYAQELGIELSAGEVMQVMNMSADDVASHCLTFTPGGCKPGWDQHWGYGRVNAYEALKRLGVPVLGIPETIPPDVRITSPRWWTNLDPYDTPTVQVEGTIGARGRLINYELQIARGVEPDDGEFLVVSTGSGSDIQGVLGTVSLWDYVSEQDVEKRPDHHDDFTFTLRVQAWYGTKGGKQILGEARKAVAVFSDRDPNTGMLDGFPVDVGASGEGSPVFYDLDGASDGLPEIVVATSDGRVLAFSYNADSGPELVSGFPVELPMGTYFPDGILGTPAVGPLFGDATPIIVVATLQGHVYALWPDGNDHAGGPYVPGFPVSAAPRDPSTSETYGHGRSILASPVLADLDNDGLLEIIAASYDQFVYAWKPVDQDKDGVADTLDGWPVLARSSPDQVPPEKVCDNDAEAQILATPAVAVLDPGSEDPAIAEHLAVIVGTAEVCTEGALPASRVYAIYHNGNDHPEGPFLPGWPAAVAAPVGDAIPIPPITIGATTSPAVYWDAQADTAYIGVGTFFWLPLMLEYKDEKLKQVTLRSSLNMSVSANGCFGRLDDSTTPYYIYPTAGFMNFIEGKFYLESFNICAWKTGHWKDLAFKKRLDDIQFFVNPAVGDLNGDGDAEIISGSSGYIVRAWNLAGQAPEGWPKFTQHFHTGTTTLGDMDGDGKSDVVAYTREGFLFGWRTQGDACRDEGINSDWWNFSHDEWNTGTYGTDTIPPGLAGDLAVYTTDAADRFELVFTAPGDDARCGTATEYDLRYTTEKDLDLNDPAVFESAPTLTAPAPTAGGVSESFKVQAAGARAFALRAVDEGGLIGHISPSVEPGPAPDDDDDDDDDDTDGDDDDADDDDFWPSDKSDSDVDACCG